MRGSAGWCCTWFVSFAPLKEGARAAVACGARCPMSCSRNDLRRWNCGFWLTSGRFSTLRPSIGGNRPLRRRLARLACRGVSLPQFAVSLEVVRVGVPRCVMRENGKGEKWRMNMSCCGLTGPEAKIGLLDPTRIGRGISSPRIGHPQDEGKGDLTGNRVARSRPRCRRPGGASDEAVCRSESRGAYGKAGPRCRRV